MAQASYSLASCRVNFAEQAPKYDVISQSMPAYVLLHGAKKNVGDFLIFERAKALLRTHKSSPTLFELPRWESLETHLDTINKSDALILCGGPGYGKKFYPEIFPLTKQLSDIRVPIVPMGIGWGVGNTSSSIEQFTFSEPSLHALREIHQRIQYSSVRDLLTEKVILQTRIKNVLMTGCPAWYNIPTIDRIFEPPQKIRKLVVTTPAQPGHFRQAETLIVRLAKLFPQSQRYLAFHRGILPDKYTSVSESIRSAKLALLGFTKGFRILDLSYSAAKLDFYEQCDLHIGYRVHAHIDFLSLRKPSLLLQEDARGMGQSITLGTKDVAASSSDAIVQVERLLEYHHGSEYQDFNQTFEVMRSHYATMCQFLKSF